MASVREAAVEDALNVLVSATEKSVNLRNDLRQDILKAVSSLRKEFVNLRNEGEDKNKLIVDLELKASATSTIHKALQSGVGSSCSGDQEVTSLGLKMNSKDSAWKVAYSSGSTKRSYSDVLADRRQGNVPNDSKMYKLFVKSKNGQSAEFIRTLRKSKVNPTQLKLGISALKTLKNGHLLIESDKKGELEDVGKKINEVSGEELESYIPILKNPRIIVFNVPEDITSENAAQAIVLQNSELNLNESEIKPRFMFEDRKKAQELGNRG